MEGAPGTLYEGEKFQLLFKFSSRYPFDSPQVRADNEINHTWQFKAFGWDMLNHFTPCNV